MRLTISVEPDSFEFDMAQEDALKLLKLAEFLGKLEADTKAILSCKEKKVMEIPEENINSAIRRAKEKAEKVFTAKAPEQTDYLNDGKYKGFLLIRCEDCGSLKGFCAKTPIDIFRCDDCGGTTKLEDLRAAYMDCECGRHFKYRTNEKAEVLTYNCLDCGSPVDMMLNSKRTAYTTIK